MPARLHKGFGNRFAIAGICIGKPGGEFIGVQAGVIALQIMHQGCGGLEIAGGVQACREDKAGEPKIRREAHSPMSGLQRVLEISKMEIAEGRDVETIRKNMKK